MGRSERPDACGVGLDEALRAGRARSGRVRARWCGGVALLVALLGLVPSARPAGAQPLARLLSQVRAGSAPGDVLDPATEERALDTATRSFGYAATQRVDAVLDAHPGAPEAVVERLRARAAQATESFASAARDELVRAKGDGLLTKKELADEIAEAREAQLARLEEALRAALAGADPAPRRDAFDSGGAWLAALARYTLSVRNASADWGRFAARLAGTFGGALLLLAAARRVLRGREGRARTAARGLRAVRGPALVVAAALGLAWGLEQLWLPAQLEQRTWLAAELGVAAALLWVVWGLSGTLGRRIAGLFLRERGKASDEMADVLRKGVRMAALGAFAMVLAEGVFGTELTTLLAGVGLIGVVATIAAQDTLRNVVGSVTLHGDRPFLVGDLVWFHDRYGTVEEIGFRSTRIRTLDGPVLVVPNAELVREPLVNLSLRSWVRHEDTLDLVYGTPPERVREAVGIVHEILQGQEHPDARPPHVAFEGFGSHSLRLRLWYWSKTADWWEAQQHRSRVNEEILRCLREAGLELAFPTRTLHVASAPAGPPAARGPGEEPADAPGG